MFNLGYRSLEPSGYQILQTLWGKESRDINPSGFKRPQYDAAYEQFLRTPAGTERTALARKMSELSQAWMPMILHTYGIGNVVYYPWVQGYRPSPFGGSWKYADLDQHIDQCVGLRLQRHRTRQVAGLERIEDAN
jgi:ABC-type transport system substrate-binding protein